MKIVQYFKGIGTELKHVTWPTRREAILLTTIVVVLTLVAGYYLGLLDLIFTKLLGLII
jgi:preprotein translocase subunit SecE